MPRRWAELAKGVLRERVSTGGGAGRRAQGELRGEGRRDRARGLRPRRPVPVDRRLPDLDMIPDPRFRHRDDSGRRGLEAHLGAGDREGDRAGRGGSRLPAPAPGHRAATSLPPTCTAWSRSPACSRATTACTSGRSARPGTPGATSSSASSTASRRYTPQLVSWNGSGFDLPVLHYRALVHGIAGCCYWATGDGDYDEPRVQVQQLPEPLPLAPRRPHGRPRAPTRTAPGRRSTRSRSSAGCPASSAWTARRSTKPTSAARSGAIRNYCETDVANTFLLFQRFQLIRGALDPAAYDREIALARATIEKLEGPHWREFLARWP